MCHFWTTLYFSYSQKLMFQIYWRGCDKNNLSCAVADSDISFWMYLLGRMLLHQWLLFLVSLVLDLRLRAKHIDSSCEATYIAYRVGQKVTHSGIIDATCHEDRFYVKFACKRKNTIYYKWYYY